MLDDLTPEVRRKCISYLYNICGHQALLPRSLAIPLCYDPTGYPLCHGGSADVWKGQYCGQEVAAKVLRVYSKNDLERITRVGHWFYSQFVVCINGRLYFVEVLRGGHRMEGPLPSEHPPAIRRDGDHESICNGIGVDGER